MAAVAVSPAFGGDFGEAVTGNLWLLRKIGAERDCGKAARLLVRGRQLVRNEPEAKELKRQAASVSQRCTREVHNELHRLRLSPEDLPGVEVGLSRQELREGFHRDRSKAVVIDTAPKPNRAGRPRGVTEIRQGRDGKMYQYRKRGGEWRKVGPA